jgi:hypothetical protein
MGNVTVNGQELMQESHGDKSFGDGIINDDEKVIAASWEFDCVIGPNSEESAQLLKFTIQSVDGNVVEDVGFSVTFRQAPTPEIVMIDTDSPSSETQAFPQLAEDKEEDKELPGLEYHDIEQELAELEWLRSQVHELKFQIRQREESIAMFASQDMDFHAEDCDSLGCFIRAGIAKAQRIAHKVKHKVFVSGKKPQFDFPGWKHRNGSHHNKTCHGPKHNHTHPHPPPHWRKPHRPHFKFPPLCHCPPPPPHRKPPHHGRPEGRPTSPDHGFAPSPPHHEGRPGFSNHESSSPPHHEDSIDAFPSPPPPPPPAHYDDSHGDFLPPPPPPPHRSDTHGDKPQTTHRRPGHDDRPDHHPMVRIFHFAL